jgi:glycosyltransferase involved in cell wall biosynthesis
MFFIFTKYYFCLTTLLLNIVIPVFNEEQYIYAVVEDIVLSVENLGVVARIIIVDDCSIDNTSKELDRIKATFTAQEIIITRNEKNYGKGFCLRKGFSLCSSGIIIIQDADLEYSPSDYQKLIDPIQKNRADVVYGSRFQGSEPKRVLYFTHFLANRFLTTLSNIFTGLNLSDIETCYKAFKTELLEYITLKENRFGFEPEITAKLSRIKGIRFVEVGISYFGRTYSEGKKIRFRDALRTFFCIFKYNIWSRK